jgi:ABC-type branched-subunit amino acid transport system substrate-binding protein
MTDVRKGLRWGIPLLLVALLAAACGSDKKGSPAAPAATPTTVKLTGTPIKFSIMTVLSGPGYQPGRVDGAKAAAKAINAAGGVKGHPLEIVACDTGLTTQKPTGAVDCANSAIKAGVVASTGDAQGDANVLQVFSDANVAEIGAFPINTGDYLNADSFPLQAGGPMTLSGQARALADAGAKKISLIATQIPQAELSKTFANQGLKPLGLEISQMVLIPPDPSTDFAPYIAKAIAGGTDGLIIALTSDGMIRVVKGAKQSGYKGKIATLPVFLDQKTIVTLGADAEGILAAGAYQATGSDNERVKLFRAEMAAYNPDAPISEYSEEPWIAVHFAAERLASLPTLDAKALRDSLSGSQVDLHGVAPSFTFSPPANAVPGLARIFQVLVQYQTVKGGKVVPLGDGTFSDPRAPKS